MALDLDFLPLNKNVRILNSHECGIFALEKPAGKLSHPNKSGVAAAKNAILVADYSLKQKCYLVRTKTGEAKKVFLLNRLDSPTSGVVLFSLDEKIAHLAREAFDAGAVSKTYFALIFGDVSKKELWQNFLLLENGSGLRVRVVPDGRNRRAMFAETTIETIDRKGDIALVKLSPHTGRTHQLRVQCAEHGCPIVGDKSYGDFSLNKKVEKIPSANNRLFLHAASTTISLGNVEFSAESPLPQIFTDVLSAL